MVIVLKRHTNIYYFYVILIKKLQKNGIYEQLLDLLRTVPYFEVASLFFSTVLFLF